MTLKNQAFRIVGACIAIVVALLVFDFYKAYPVKDFCENLPITATPPDVLALAKNKGLEAFDVINARGAISVLNHKAPFFRHACDIEFRDGKIVRKTVLTAD